MAVDKVTTRAKKTRTKTRKAPLHDIFTATIKTDLKVECVKEFKFHPTRRWRFDYAIPEHKIALEVEGGVWTNGRHTRGKGFLGDMEKYNAAASLGWRLFRCVPSNLLSKDTFLMINQAINGGL